jgi:hypothetical protein
MFNRRLLLIPVWLVAQYLWNVIGQHSLTRGFEVMTSLDSIWVSFIVTAAIVYYASKATAQNATTPPKK